MNYSLGTGAVALFLAIVCAEGVLIAAWRYIQSFGKAPKPMAVSNAKPDLMSFRRQLVLGFALILLTEGGHNVLRAYGHMSAGPWPQGWAFWLTFIECGSILFLIRTFTKAACGEWGWVWASVLPAAAAVGMIVALR